MRRSTVLVMLDLDNTLGNRTAAVAAWVDEFVTEHELPTDAPDWILRTDNDGYSSRLDVFASIKDRYRLPASVEELVADYQDRVIALAAPTLGAMQCLQQLRGEGNKLAIVTNGSAKQQHGKIDAIGFRPLVDAVIVSGDLDVKKPDRRIFEAASAATGESLTGSWMVGDSALHDVVGAQALGIKTAWIHRGRAWPDEYDPPTVIIDDLTQLVASIATRG